jgi:broad specificity phosphatase PhoE
VPARQQVVLIRHGQSTANASGIWQGQLDFPLSDEGQQQARLAGRALAGERIDGLYTSPLSRASETAQIIARETGFRGEILPVEGLKERSGGMLEGTTREEREASNAELMEQWLSLPEELGWTLVGAETDEEVLARFEEALSEIRARHVAGDRILIVSHGGAMRAFLRDRFGPSVLVGSQRAPNASITRVDWGPDGEGPRLLQLASTEHLSNEHRPRTS